MSVNFRVKQRLQAALRQQSSGLLGLANLFKTYDTDHSGSLSWEEFCSALQKCGLAPSPQDIRAIFLDLDKDGNNEISYQEFIHTMRGDLSNQRKALIMRIFESIDSDGDGTISMTDIGKCFNPKNHPDVRAGRSTVAGLLKDFFDSLGTVSETGFLNLAQFTEYYANSAAFDDDIKFAETMKALWTLHGPSSGAGAQHKIPSTAHLVSSISGLLTDIDPGVSQNLEKLREQLRARGARGFVGLQRKFRIMDDDGSKSLNLVEFKKGLKECGLNLTELQMSQLFSAFDRDRNGVVDFEEFLAMTRGPLSQRRTKLIGMAFSVIDKNGSGEVDIEDIVGVYNASKHPDVVAGRRTEDEILREFLDTFDVGGVKDGKVTKGEFENYYNNVSASIDDDDYFELMIRNAWHISGGQGWSANSANKRVLVTHADGRETVEEIKNDLGLRAGDKEGMMARLRGQGVNTVSNASSYGQAGDSNYSLASAANARNGRAPAVESLTEKVSKMKIGGLDLDESALKVAKAGPAAGAMSRGVDSILKNLGTVGKLSSSVPSHGLIHIIQKLKAELRVRGATGFIGLQRKFRIMDDDNNKSLDLSEFKKAMKEMNMNLSDAELRMLFDYFDVNRSATIDFEEFIQGVREPLNERRLRLAQIAFSKLDKDGNGIVDAAEVAGMYDASRHPEVISGRMTEREVMNQFLDTFDVGGVKDGMVTQDEFINYYTNLGANIDNDDYFELMIRNAWHISGGQGWSANSANKRVLVTHADGRETVEEIKNDLGLRAGDKEGMMARLLSQSVEATSVSGHGSAGDQGSLPRAQNLQDALRLSNSNEGFQRPSARSLMPPPPPNKEQQVSSLGPVSRPNNGIRSSSDFVKAYAPSKLPPNVVYLVGKMKTEMKARGAHGFVGLQRKFRIIDDNNSRSICLAEFKKAMKELNMKLSDVELRTLFEFFDTNNNGSIDFEEFIQGVRDPLNERRLQLVVMAFGKLDKDGSGIVDAAEIAGIYDASKHPDVLSGKRTPNQVLTEFLDTFDVGGVKDGMVTQDEFINYYTNLGANIDNDDYFELMIRNAWHISGGQSWSANSANKRVLVTHADGRETVEEIKNDLGLRAGDKEGMMARLREQGVFDATGVSAHGSADDDASKGITGAKRRTVQNVFRGTMQPGLLPGSGVEQKPQPSVSKLSKADRPSAPVGIRVLIDKFKAEMRGRGSLGFIGLQRKFRIMDDDGNHVLSMGEFKKAIKETNLKLSEAEQRMLFEYFDTDRSGGIDFEEFIQGVRDALTPKRLELVKLAFRVLDKDGNGMVDAAEVAGMYDASRHPEVISGRMTEREVMNQFLDTFDVGGVKDGMVTQDEFINYYTNLGANIDNDDYFELMIRNAWHISGGQSWSANSANKRVLVTHADGRETVEEIKNDLGLRAGDKEGMMARLRGQGVDSATSLSSFGQGGDKGSKFGQRPSKSNEAVSLGQLAKSVDGPTSAYVPKSSAPVSRLPTTAATKARKAAAPPSFGIKVLLDKLKAETKSRGASGYIGLQRKFKIIDDDNNRSINLSEFKKAMKEMNMNLSDAELRMVFDHFDTDHSATIDFEEFIQGFREPLNERRLSLAKLAFSVIDKDGNGMVDAAEVAGMYDASRHPEVISGRMTEREVMNQFLDTFDVGGVKDGMVTQDEFINYYTNLGANIDNDDYFELMIRNAWHISGGQGWSANSANKRVLVTHADGRETVEEVRHDIDLSARDAPGMIARLKAQGNNASSIALFGNAEYGKEAARRPNTAPEQITGSRKKGVEITRAAIQRSSIVFGDDVSSNPSNKKPVSSKPGSSLAIAAAGGPRQGRVEQLLVRLRAELAKRGARGIVGLQRKFRIMDDNGDCALSLGEFHKAMLECNLNLSEEDILLLFRHFDLDGNETLDFEEFLQGVRGPMNNRRKQMVGLAYSVLDKNGNGVIEPDDVIDTYDASKHPDVLTGKRTPDEVFREFLDTFDVGGVKDGKVTKGEFENYYNNVSASIDDDDYFELMIRNAWHISGGQSWSANSANKRVLVTHADGRETVEEIKNDLGLRAGDKEGMMARLRGQGTNAVAAAGYGGYEDAYSPKTRGFGQRSVVLPGAAHSPTNNRIFGAGGDNDNRPSRKPFLVNTQISIC